MLNTFYKTPTILPNTGLIYVKGFDKAESYQTSASTVVPIFDEDDDLVYIKTTDANGNYNVKMFRLTEEEPPKFDPKKYVSVEDFNSLKEDIHNGFESLRKSIEASAANATSNESTTVGKKFNKSNNEQYGSQSSVQ